MRVIFETFVLGKWNLQLFLIIPSMLTKIVDPSYISPTSGFVCFEGPRHKEGVIFQLK